MKGKYTFLGGPTGVKDSPSHAKLSGIKQEASKFIDLNNRIVERIWRLELLLSETSNIKTQKAVQESLNLLKKTLQTANVEETIKTLLDEIQKMEIELNGTSTISDSPFTLTR
jgi:hypothetical protein